MMICKTTILKAAAFAVVLTAAACGNKNSDGKTSTGDSTATGADMSDFQEVKKNTYSMKLPKDMTSTTTLNEEASLQYQNIYKETYVVVIDESKKEFVDVFKQLGTYDSSKTALNNYSTAQANFFKESVEKLKSDTKPAAAKINGLNAEIMEMEAKVEGVPLDIYYMIAYVEGKDKLYTIMTWTMPERKDKYKADLEAAIRSFKEL